MRASGGVYLTPAPRLSSTVRSVAIMLASANTQTMALCCVSWIFFLPDVKSTAQHTCMPSLLLYKGSFTAAVQDINHTTQLTKSIFKWTENELLKIQNQVIYVIYP